MELKVSHYSIFFARDDGNVVAVNTLYRTAALIRREDAAELQRILADPDGYAADPTGKQPLFNALRRSLFLVDEDLDETGLLKMRSLAGQFDSVNFVFGMMPTLRCNFRCRYCYVTPQSPDMNEDIQQGILTWLGTKYFGSLLCGWFGGEPLLRLDVMRKMISKMQALCQRQGSSFQTMMSTNGYLLTPPVIRELEGLGFTNLQITLDGPREIHDQMRPLANGRGTFDVLIENIGNLLALTKGLTLHLRINLDESNIEAAYSMFETWPAPFKDERVLIYTKLVFPHPQNWGERADCGAPDLFRKSIEVLKHLAKRGYHLNFSQWFGFGGATRCEFDFYHNFLIGPEGNMYKCSVAFETGERVGRLTPDGKAVFDLPRLVKRMSRDPFTVEKCLPCQLLPLCGGSCAYILSLGKQQCYLDYMTLQEAAEVIYLDQRMKRKAAGGARQST